MKQKQVVQQQVEQNTDDMSSEDIGLTLANIDLNLMQLQANRDICIRTLEKRKAAVKKTPDIAPTE